MSYVKKEIVKSLIVNKDTQKFASIKETMDTVNSRNIANLVMKNQKI